MKESVFRAGTLAYVDTFAGMIPAKVTRVIAAGSGSMATAGEIEAKLTATRGAYKKGEKIVGSASKIVPRKMVRGRRVLTNYRWERGNGSRNSNGNGSESEQKRTLGSALRRDR